MQIQLYQIDAFTDQLFSGNPAAVCILDTWLPDKVMQHIAAENNLAETAFAVAQNDQYEIRWFTPATEVDLCGHATLATAYVLFQYFPIDNEVISFYSPHSGRLTVAQSPDGYLKMDFPTDVLEQVPPIEMLHQALGDNSIATFKGKTDYLLIFPNQKVIEALQPDFRLLQRVKARGVIVSAPGENVDFVSRFFAPQSGIDEDPVTGSAHTTLTPYWSQELDKKRMSAQQLSSRGGHLICEYQGERVYISGKAVLYLAGEIYV